MSLIIQRHMPRVSEHKQAILRRVIRDTMAVDPLISMNALQRAIETKIKRPLDIAFLRKLVRRVTGELVVIADKEKVEERISQLREKNRIITEELFRIAFPSQTDLNQGNITERRKALESIARIENAQVKLEMDLGIFNRHLGSVKIDHQLRPLDDQTRDAIKLAFMNWNVFNPMGRKVEQAKVIEIKELGNGKPELKPTESKPVPAQIPTAGATGLAVSQ